MKNTHKYEVYCTSGTVSHKVHTFDSYHEAEAFCNYYEWTYDYNGGLVWDLEIVED